MTLSSQLARDVAFDVKERGREYHRRGAAHILTGDAWLVEARVVGTDDYRVELNRDKNQIFAWCTCPYFQDREKICKHIWATLLTADNHGYLSGSGSTARVRLKPDLQASDDYWDEDAGPNGWDEG